MQLDTDNKQQQTTTTSNITLQVMTEIYGITLGKLVKERLSWM
jgi:hypothetical protein